MVGELVNRVYDKGGSLRREEPYLNGVLHGALRAYHSNGKLASEEIYTTGRLNGLCRQWAWDGRLLGSYSVENGTGIQRSWHDNGQLCSEFSVLDGKSSGRSRHWLADGTLILDEYLLDGRPVTREEYRAACAADFRLPHCDDNFVPVHLEGPDIERKKVELLIEMLMAQSNHDEVTSWLKSASEDSFRFLGRFHDSSSALSAMDQLYAAGAVKVIALDIYGNVEGKEFCDKLALAMPTKQQLRRAIRDTCCELKTQIGLSFGSLEDFGENYLYLLLD